MTFRTRFAPSPTGPLHLGHAYSALLAHDMALAAGGQFLLRIEDIDQSRARAAWEDQIYDDLAWLGLHWPQPVMRQSERLPAYSEALDRLWDLGLLYPCICRRADIKNALSAPQEGVPMFGPDGMIYPGTCRSRADRSGPRPTEGTLRLDMAAAFDHLGERQTLTFREVGQGADKTITASGTTMSKEVGDIVLARQGMGTSYHLSVVCDDAEQGITDVVRGEDLFDATQIHVLLQQLLDLPTPTYHHHLLIRDDTGRRLAKRDDARAIRLFRDEGLSRKEIRTLVGL